MQEVIGSQTVFPLRLLDGIRHLTHLALGESTVFVGAHAQAVKDGSDP